MSLPPLASGARVLIIDDDSAVSDSFSRTLRLEGCEVWSALSADQGLTLARTHRPHAVIVNLRMPLRGGLALLRHLRDIPALAATPVAIVTGDYGVDDGQTAEVQALGAQIWYKPLWLRELLALARDLISGAGRN